MPAVENYQDEISDGRNCRNVTCKFCNSVILTRDTATLSTFEFELPLIKQTKDASETETETVSLFWTVDDIYTFQNVGFSHKVGDNKYLACADCEAGPIGFHNVTSNASYVALSRVQHA